MLFRGWVSFSVVLLAATISHAALVVDDFGVGPVSLTTNGPQLSDGPQQTQTGLDPARVLGGERFVSIGVNANEGSQTVGPSSTPATLIIQPGSTMGEFTFDTAEGPPTNVHNYFTLRYGSGAKPLGLNLTQVGDRFLIQNVRSTGLGGTIAIAINFRSSNTNAEINLPASDTPYNVEVPFTNFESANFAVVNEIYIETSRARGPWTVSFDDVSIVPEPASLLWLAGAGFLLRRKRTPALA